MMQAHASLARTAKTAMVPYQLLQIGKEREDRESRIIYSHEA